jgi:hypothetical protein
MLAATTEPHTANAHTQQILVLTALTQWAYSHDAATVVPYVENPLRVILAVPTTG